MKKIMLLEIKQKDKSFFMGVLNPREVIKLIDIPLKNTNQDCNRPWKEKRVQEIAKYVAGLMDISERKGQTRMAKGYLVNCPVLSLSKPFKICKDHGMNYIDFPETEDEISTYYGNICILDGQHRLISFANEYIYPNMGDCSNYDMGFIIVTEATTREKQEIFMITNDKQDKVESNVLKLMKRWLGLLSDIEDYLYTLTERLNQEDISPLKDKIIIGGNKIAGGFKAAQVIKILDKSGLYSRLNEHDDDEQIKNICVYLSAWREVYEGKFLNSKYFLGKTTGLRYICYLFPVILDILENQQKKYTKENIKSILAVLYNMTIENAEAHEYLQASVRSESGTIAVARLHSEELKRVLFNQEERFNVFSNN